MIYKIGITSYDNDHQLWETHIGTVAPDGGELLYSVWGKTEQESMFAASLLKTLLVQFMNIS